jgi:hypothetical protein
MNVLCRLAAACSLLATVALAACGETDRPPEEVVREYVEAFDRADEAACDDLVTDDFLTSAVRDRLGVEEARRACIEQLEALERERVAVVLIPAVDTRGDVSNVTVRIERGDERPLQRITLRRVDGEWRVDRVRPIG